MTSRIEVTGPRLGMDCIEQALKSDLGGNWEEKINYFDYLLEQKEWHVTHPSASRHCMSYASCKGTMAKSRTLGHSADRHLASEASGLPLYDHQGSAICIISGEPRCFRPVPSKISFFFSLCCVELKEPRVLQCSVFVCVRFKDLKVASDMGWELDGKIPIDCDG